jgi:hypothetical protein
MVPPPLCSMNSQEPSSAYSLLGITRCWRSHMSPRENAARISVRPASVRTGKLEVAKPFDLDHFRAGALLSPDVAESENLFETGADGDCETDRDRCDCEGPAIPGQNLHLTQPDQRRNQRAADHYSAAQRIVFPLVLARTRIPPDRVVEPSGLAPLLPLYHCAVQGFAYTLLQKSESVGNWR